MADALYPSFKGALLSQNPSINLASDVIKVALINTGSYTFNSTHQYWSSASGASVSTPQQLTGVGTTGGAFSSGSVTFPSVTGSQASALILFKDTGSAPTSPLIAYLDAGANLPVVPTGTDIIIRFQQTSPFIFTL